MRNLKLQINGVAMNVLESSNVDCKSSIALVFLHYFGGSSRSWTEVITRLSSTHCCIAPDLRGFGDSDSTPTGYSVAENANDVAALIEALGLEKYVLIGHSMGGKIALAFAARQPAGLQKLILLAPSPPSPEPIDDATRAHLLSTHGTRQSAAQVIGKVSARPLPGAVFERAVEDNLKTSVPAWRAWLESGSREDISSQMASVAVPTSVVAGEKDEAMTPNLLSREVVARIPNASLVVVPDAAHLLPLEAPEEVAQILGRLLGA